MKIGLCTIGVWLSKSTNIKHTLECLIAVHVRLFFFQNFGRMYGLIRHCMSIYTRITEFITYKKPKIITVCITILSYLYVKYALLQACMFKNSLKQLCLYVYMDCTAIKHSRVPIFDRNGLRRIIIVLIFSNAKRHQPADNLPSCIFS